MATDAYDELKELDQFFDFDAAHGACQGGDEFITSSENDIVMDWQPTLAGESTALPLSQRLLSYDEHTQQTPQNVAAFHSLQQWSLVQAPDPSLTLIYGDVDPRPIPTWPTGILGVSPDPFHYPEAHRGPSNLESVLAYEGSILANVDDREGVTDTSNLHLGSDLSRSSQQGLEVSSQAHVEPIPNLSQVRPSGPLRQNSTVSWKPASAKRKGPQNRIPLEAKQILEDEFAANPYPCSWEMDIIAHQANLEVKKVRNWFNNRRARKKEDPQPVSSDMDYEAARSLKSKLSKDSLKVLNKQTGEAVQPPQPPLAVYLAQSYQEEAVEFSDVQAAIENASLSGSGDFQDDAWSDSKRQRNGSVVTSIASSEGTAPTTYTLSSNGSHSNISSFGRDRRRGRRRMAWKESPYNRSKFNGVNSAGETQADLPFFCTFCPRAFKTKYEWIRHEDSVHALRTTWICCDTKNAPLPSCPFCGQMHPDDAHMATHKYHQCRNKPESQRTFYRRDHFVQHLHHVHFASVKHPSVRIGCQARLMATEGHNFGCKDLAMKWRRFGAPMKQDDPMLHCGFCGKKSKDWLERCEHIAEHLIARELDRAVWWPERMENHLENLYSAVPFESFRCRYCRKVFTDTKSMNEHSHCRVWSCRFLSSFGDVAADNAGPPLCPDFPSAKAHHCYLCGAGYRALHVEHAQSYHRYRSCNQEFYTSEEAFLQHLHNFHGSSQPALLQGSSVIEQNFMRNKGASFEPVEFNESMQPCFMDLDTAPLVQFTVAKKAPVMPSHARKDQAYPRKPVPAQKLAREQSQHAPSGATRAQKQRSNNVTPKSEPQDPRFFRLSTYAPFLSSRIFYSRNGKRSELPSNKNDVLEEIPKPHVASLVMSAGLVSMAVARWAIKSKNHKASGMVELTLEDDAG